MSYGFHGLPIQWNSVILASKHVWNWFNIYYWLRKNKSLTVFSQIPTQSSSNKWKVKWFQIFWQDKKISIPSYLTELLLSLCIIVCFFSHFRTNKFVFYRLQVIAACFIFILFAGDSSEHATPMRRTEIKCSVCSSVHLLPNHPFLYNILPLH